MPFLLNVPLIPTSNVDALIDAGASMFYCGYVEIADGRVATPLNQLQNIPQNFTDAQALAASVDRAHSRGRPVSLILNASFFEQARRNDFLRCLDLARAIGIDGVVVGSMTMLQLVRERFPDALPIASVALGIGNAGAARFAYAEGIRRVVVPHHVKPAEARDLASQVPDMEFEVFIKNFRCACHTATCGFMHGHWDGFAWDNGCRSLAGSTEESPLRFDACGACFLPDFVGPGNLRVLKIVGRDMPPDRVLADVRFLNAAVEALGPTGRAPGFADQVRRLYPVFHGQECRKNCYYPGD